MSEVPFSALAQPVSGWRRMWSNPGWSVIIFFIACLGVGALFSPVWAWLAHRPGYVVRDDLTATISERGLAEVFASDALFVIVTGALGIAVGAAAWLLFPRAGWWVAPLAITGSGGMALMLWQVGMLVGQQGFAERLAAASAGQVVPIDLELHALAALLVGPFLTITVVMLLAAFWPERTTLPPPDQETPPDASG